MTIDDVNKLASLARIDMSQSEKEEFLGNMESILGYIDIIKKADVSGIELAKSEVRNVMREDANPNETGFFTDRIIKEMPDSEAGYLKVKQIL